MTKEVDKIIGELSKQIECDYCGNYFDKMFMSFAVLDQDSYVLCQECIKKPISLDVD
jgi:hypothetical protein